MTEKAHKPADKPRILIIENATHVTGGLKSITRSAYYLREHYEFLFVLSNASQGRFWIENKGFAIVKELPMKEISRKVSSWLLYVPYLVSNTFKLYKIVKKNSISIIHVNDLYNLLPVTLRLVGCRVPYLCHVRFMPERFPKRLLYFWLSLHFRYASRVIAVSQSVLNQLPVHTKLMFIHNELPTEERYTSVVHTSDPASKPRYFLYLSNFIQGKGQQYALQAFASIHTQLPNWRLRFVGGDMGLEKNKQYKKKLLQTATALLIAKKIEWAEFTEDVEQEYKHADITLNFSESESFSITCVESLFFGRPVIATDCGGPAEIVDNEETGLIVPNQDVAAMAKAMVRLASDEQLVKEMGKRANQKVRSKFSIEQTSGRLKTVYDNVIVQLNKQ
jgi:L-malate glycosyltransferase